MSFVFKHRAKGAYIGYTLFIRSKPVNILSYHKPALFKWYEILPEIKSRHINLTEYKICMVKGRKEVTENA
jgi:hypothetical protein